MIVLGRFDQLTSVWRRDGTQFEFTWLRSEDIAEDPNVNEEDAPQVEEPPSPAEIYESALTALARAPFELRILASGEIAAVRGLSAAMRAIELSGEIQPTALGMLRPDLFSDALQPAWDLCGLAERRERLDGGEPLSWSQTRRVALGPAGSIEIETAWAVAPADPELGPAQEARGRLNARVVAPSEPSPSQPSVEVGNAGGEATLPWTMEVDGPLRLQEWKESLTLVSRWRLGDLETAISQRARRGLRRLD